jgi:hypothetical protein
MTGSCDRSVVFSGFSNKTDRHDVTEILLKVVLYTITITPSTKHYTESYRLNNTNHAKNRE